MTVGVFQNITRVVLETNAACGSVPRMSYEELGDHPTILPYERVVSPAARLSREKHVFRHGLVPSRLAHVTSYYEAVSSEYTHLKC